MTPVFDNLWDVRDEARKIPDRWFRFRMKDGDHDMKMMCAPSGCVYDDIKVGSRMGRA